MEDAMSWNVKYAGVNNILPWCSGGIFEPSNAVPILYVLPLPVWLFKGYKEIKGEGIKKKINKNK